MIISIDPIRPLNFIHAHLMGLLFMEFSIFLKQILRVPDLRQRLLVVYSRIRFSYAFVSISRIVSFTLPSPVFSAKVMVIFTPLLSL